MKRFYLLSTIITTLLTFACSNNSATSETSNTAGNKSVNGAIPATATAEANSGIPGITGASSNSDPKGMQQQRIPEKSGGIDTQVAEATRDAPDNSTFSSRLTDIGVETRAFKNHPQLVKVVKTIAPGKTDVKVYLKNGKVVDVPADKIANLATIPAMDILSLVGINPTPGPPAPGKKEGTEKQ